MGLIPVGGYYVEVGFGPRIIGVHSAKDFETLSGIISSQKFKDLTLQIKSLVYNYRTAILESTGRVKKEYYTIQKSVWKLNQYYDLRPDKKEEYKDSITNEHLPTMEKIDYVEVAGG